MAVESQPLVSVVTPVYNGEKYLAQCIESVVAQTYENWEYVIVNNCSTDGSLEIIQRYAGQDPRIRICNNDEFLSQMQNWNRAMRQISPASKYCKVVHADDWLFPDCLSQMVALAEAHPSVGIVSAYRLDENRVNLDGLPYPSTVTPGREIGRAVLRGGLHLFGSPTSLLVRSDLVREREKFYDESAVGADTQVCFDLLHRSDFGFVHQVLTYTRRHNESVTSLTHRFNIRRVGRLVRLLEYGPTYLDRQEYERRLARVLDGHYNFLARSVLELREKAFWDYHRGVLRDLGYPMSLVKLIKALLWRLLNLRDAANAVKRGLKRRRGYDLGEQEGVLSAILTQENDEL